MVDDPVDPAPRPQALRPRRRLLLWAPLVLLAAAAGLLVLQHQARRAFVGNQTICTVTAAALRYDASLTDAQGTMYGGGDHPLDPSVGDRYVGYSGCNPFETSCERNIEFIGTRLVC